MYKVQVQGPWFDDGSGNRRAQILEDFPLEIGVVDYCGEVAGQVPTQVVPEPNLTVWEVICNQATLDALEADATYNVLISEVL